MSTETTFAFRLNLCRNRLKLSQAGLSQKLEVTAQSIQLWESGKTTPRRNRISKLAKVLGVNPAWLETGTGPIKPESKTAGKTRMISINSDEINDPTLFKNLNRLIETIRYTQYQPKQVTAVLKMAAEAIDPQGNLST